MINLKGQTVLVTGGSRGIGRAVCLLCARAGADIVVGYHRAADAAEAVVAEVRGMGREAVAVAGDLTQTDGAAELIAAAERRFGRVDTVVASAGIWERAPIDTMTEAEWRATMAANLDSVYYTTAAAVRHMKAGGGGRIILIGSTAGQRGEAFYSHYAASKGALIALTRSLADELGPYDIRVNCVAPGWVRTDMTRAVFDDPDREAEILARIPLRRIAEPEDVAGAVLFLASDLAYHIQGQVIGVNGGSVLQ